MVGNTDFLRAPDCRKRTDGLRTIKTLSEYPLQLDIQGMYVEMTRSILESSLITVSNKVTRGEAQNVPGKPKVDRFISNNWITIKWIRSLMQLFPIMFKNYGFTSWLNGTHFSFVFLFTY